MVESTNPATPQIYEEEEENKNGTFEDDGPVTEKHTQLADEKNEGVELIQN